MMRVKCLVVVLGVCALAASLAVPARADDKAPALGKAKFKEIAKYLGLSAEQQSKVKPDVERIQEIVKAADKQRGAGWGGGGRRAPVGGSGVFGRPSPDNAGGGEVTAGKFEEVRAQRKEWQTEIDNRVEEIKTFLTPAQVEKFKTIEVPNLMELPSRGKW